MNKNKAIFLDRDGVLNKNCDDYVKSVNELEIFYDVIDSLTKLFHKGYILIVISNQSAINRGLTNHKNVTEIHEMIQRCFREKNIYISKFYYCPHRPDEGCFCRKPKTGLLNEAIREFNIEPKLCWLIGDSDSDVEAGQKIGCSTIKLDSHTTFELAIEKILQVNLMI